MASRIVTPLRLVVAILVVLAVAAATVVVLFGPDDGRWGIVGALGASPERSESASATPSASPTAGAGLPDPSPSRSQSRKEKNIAAAKESLVEYYSLTAEVANSGYENWERQLAPFWIKPAVRSSKGYVFEENSKSGVYTEGAATVVSMVDKNYRPDPTGSSREEVVLDACIDFSSVKTFDSDDNLIPRDASVPMRYMFSYTMRNQGPDREWALLAEDPEQELTC